MKKSLLLCFYVTSQIFGQASVDTLFTKAGKTLMGEYKNVDQESVYFQITGNDKPSKLPKDKIRKVALGNGNGVDLLSGKIIDIIEFKRIADLERKKCETNQKIKYMVFPFKGEKIARSQQYVKDFKSECYTIVNSYYAYKFFDENDISQNNISDYDIINMATVLGIDRVYIGELYIINQPFKQPYLLNEKFTINVAAELKRQQEIAVANAGAFLHETVYYIDIESRERIYIKTNNFVTKL